MKDPLQDPRAMVSPGTTKVEAGVVEANLTSSSVSNVGGMLVYVGVIFKWSA